MQTDVRQFNLALQKFIRKEVPDAVVTVQRKTSLDALRKLVKRTPVRTGRARANWQVGINHCPNDIPYPAGDVFAGGVAPKTRTKAPSLSVAGQNAVSAGNRVIGSIKKPCVCYIVNNVEYIAELEKGRSPQCPPGGMMALTVQELRESLR